MVTITASDWLKKGLSLAVILTDGDSPKDYAAIAVMLWLSAETIYTTNSKIINYLHIKLYKHMPLV